MDSNFISEPVEFRLLEGKGIDFRKTFDLRGRDTDEMLQLYLRRANLSDDIERLPAVQRQAYVYDIIRSNKGPGYWVPPSGQVNIDVFADPPPAVRPPPIRSVPSVENPYGLSMSSSSSSNSLKSFDSSGTRSTFSSSVVVSSKGSKYEISGPTNFQHVAGDVTRDRTRNAFDLGATNQANDNVLKKYMIEHGITDDDISNMRRTEIIKKIVHSNFTWIPTKADLQTPPSPVKTPTVVYATISTNNQITPPHSPIPAIKYEKPQQATVFSNYASLTSRFVDISDMPYPAQPETIQQQPVQAKPPPPPSEIRANNAQSMRPSVMPPPPPQVVLASVGPHKKKGTLRVAPPAPPKPTIIPKAGLPAEAQVQSGTRPQLASKPAPPATTQKPKTVSPVRVSVACPPATTQKPKTASSVPALPPAPTGGVPPPPPPPPPVCAIPPPPPAPAPGQGPPMPPPPPPASQNGVPLAAPVSKPPAPKPAASGGNDRDAFLESIRKGVTLKKVDQKAATISGVKPRAERKPPATDFLSELKLGITLRRVKNPADNPYSEQNADESQA